MTEDGSGGLYAALGRFVHRSPLLVACDFDGVLAEFATDPGSARPDPRAMRALREMARIPGTAVAIVSGRDLATLARLAEVTPEEPVTLIGSHGAESNRAAVVGGSASDADRALLDTVAADGADLVDQHPGARLERKKAAVAVHTRGLPREASSAALSAAGELGESHPGVKVLRGKSVVELSVQHADKGTALTALARLERAAASIYFGDDVTDEDAFRALDAAGGDVTVKVGQGDTAAAYRIGSVSDVVAALEQLLALRRDASPR